MNTLMRMHGPESDTLMYTINDKYIDDVYAASARETAARMSKGGRAKLRGGGMSQRGLGKAFKKGGKA